MRLNISLIAPFLMLVLLSNQKGICYELKVVNVKPESAPILVQDIKDHKTAKNFRSTPFSQCEINQNWSCLHASASGAYHESLLESLKTLVGDRPIYIIDLRREYHGFVNGIPISWYAYRNGLKNDKSLAQIETEEFKGLQELEKRDHFLVHRIQQKEWGVIKVIEPLDMFPNRVETEQQLVERHGLHYFRIPVLDRHKPTDDQVDLFLELVSSLPENAWVHFHCRGGKGRSTTFLVLYDIIRNGHNTSLKEIIHRNCVIGPKNLLELPPGDSWKVKPAEDRVDLLEEFYAYRNDPKGYGHNNWSSWRKSRAAKTAVGS